MSYNFLFEHKTENVEHDDLGLYTLVASYYFMKKGQIDYYKIASCVEQISKLSEVKLSDLNQLKDITDIKKDIGVIDTIIATSDTIEKIINNKSRHVTIFCRFGGRFFMVCHDTSVYHVIDFSKKKQYDFSLMSDVINYIGDTYNLRVFEDYTTKKSGMPYFTFNIDQLCHYLEIENKFDFDYSYTTDTLMSPSPLSIKIWENYSESSDDIEHNESDYRENVGEDDTCEECAI